MYRGAPTTGPFRFTTTVRAREESGRGRRRDEGRLVCEERKDGDECDGRP